MVFVEQRVISALLHRLKTAMMDSDQSSSQKMVRSTESPSDRNHVCVSAPLCPPPSTIVVSERCFRIRRCFLVQNMWFILFPLLFHSIQSPGISSQVIALAEASELLDCLHSYLWLDSKDFYRLLYWSAVGSVPEALSPVLRRIVFTTRDGFTLE